MGSRFRPTFTPDWKSKMGFRYVAKPTTGWWWYHKDLFLGWLYGKPFSCGTKINFKHPERARKAASKMEQQYKTVFDFYPCWWCGGWHVGRHRATFNPFKFGWRLFFIYRVLYPLIRRTPPTPPVKAKSEKKSRDYDETGPI